jgi:hypothetical protein
MEGLEFAMILLGSDLLRILQCFLGFDSEAVKIGHVYIVERKSFGIVTLDLKFIAIGN